MINKVLREVFKTEFTKSKKSITYLLLLLLYVMNKRSSYIKIFRAILNVLGLPEIFVMLRGRLLKILLPEQYTSF